jgi:hypothetical protein
MDLRDVECRVVRIELVHCRIHCRSVVRALTKFQALYLQMEHRDSGNSCFIVEGSKFKIQLRCPLS